ncbi:alpha-hydroxy-acid oxidizing protein [Roseomonas sp. HJA6]|uniref:Alpha-hydroxy-acid oxidizing protein n=1 Tax=Roseomonas alba TaxID=2846776 RepID=A0ABS7AF56_9PROT|nr:alpha-hydroxy acid oxidase [Neoroseomonas alba]MBW6400942.1 alpha-hydroxy-acid oxidizing protein [Neoroseomonas alba]
MPVNPETLAALQDKYLALHEFVKVAKGRLDANLWDYLVGATETETTMRRNRMGIDALALRPRVLRDVSEIDSTSTLFDKTIRLPVFLAPVGGLEFMAVGANGAVTAGEGASGFGVPIMLSSVSKPGLEDVAAAATGMKIYQLYVRGDAASIEDSIQRAKAHGYDAFCLTVDTAIYSRRERDIVRRFAKPWRASATNQAQHYQAQLNWNDVKRIKDQHPDLKLILKGIATAEDAMIAVQHGVEVVYVSNHGGRQLDAGRGSIEVLPEVVQAVGGRAKVWVDGGFSRGTDIVKALCLGAEAVGLGRLYCYALAADGAAGVVRLLEILENEFRSALGLLGVTSVAELGPGFVHAAMPTNLPHVHSAFPLLRLDDSGY